MGTKRTCAVCSGQWVRIDPVKCDTCEAPAVWRNALGGLRCGRCRRPNASGVGHDDESAPAAGPSKDHPQ